MGCFRKYFPGGLQNPTPLKNFTLRSWKKWLSLQTSGFCNHQFLPSFHFYRHIFQWVNVNKLHRSIAFMRNMTFATLPRIRNRRWLAFALAKRGCTDRAPRFFFFWRRFWMETFNLLLLLFLGHVLVKNESDFWTPQKGSRIVSQGWFVREELLDGSEIQLHLGFITPVSSGITLPTSPWISFVFFNAPRGMAKFQGSMYFYRKSCGQNPFF